MTKKIDNRPPKGEGWFWLSKKMLLSPAWRELGINARRVIEFMLAEHMAHAGQNNGKIKAPHRQLAKFGVCHRFVADAIREAEEHGLIECNRGGMRVATNYALTWLPLHDGTAASNRWRSFRPTMLTNTGKKNQKSAPQREGSSASQREGRSGKSAPQREGRCPPKSAPQREGALKRSSYQGGDVNSELSVPRCVAVPASATGPAALNHIPVLADDASWQAPRWPWQEPKRTAVTLQAGMTASPGIARPQLMREPSINRSTASVS
jgi:hypothetical protein